MKVVSWHPVLTDHQSYTLEALQQLGDCTLNVYVAKKVHAEREAQGWINQHASTLNAEEIPGKGWVKFALQHLREHRDAVHLFGSPFEQTKLIVILLLAVAMGLRVYLISEPYSLKSAGYLSDKWQYINWLKAKLRPFLYGIYGALLSQRISGVFAISCLAVSQYQRMGVGREKIFPFGYFVPFQKQAYSVNTYIADPFKKDLKIVFVGNLIATKGLDILIGAVTKLNKQGFSVFLDVYGPGNLNKYNFNHSSVRYCGVIQFGNAQEVISAYDLLVLPSRYDGWGVVVNEALMAGVPVFCSNQVGASAVVEKWECGTTFLSENESELVGKLKELMMHPERLSDMRLAASKAGKLLDPMVAGQYMFNIISQDSMLSLKRKKIKSPWYEC